MNWIKTLSSGWGLQPYLVGNSNFVKKRILNTSKYFGVSFCFRGKWSWQTQSEFFRKVKCMKRKNKSINAWTTPPSPFLYQGKQRKKEKGRNCYNYKSELWDCKVIRSVNLFFKRSWKSGLWRKRMILISKIHLWRPSPTNYEDSQGFTVIFPCDLLLKFSLVLGKKFP